MQLQPLKLRKHKIGIKEKPKFSSIRDYWDEQTTKEIFNLPREYEDLFPLSIAEHKELRGSWER